MSYVTPATAITVYKNVPMDNGYSQTVYYPSAANQESYFSGLVSKTYNNYTYQRKERDKIKVEALADDLYECNYLSFKNRSGKTFYCFITGCEYVSEACTELTFEIDVMQTYMFDYQYLPCWVERQHANSDTIGSNIQPEPVQVGDYLYSDSEEVMMQDGSSPLSTMVVVILICDVDSGQATQGVEYNGVYTGADMYIANANNPSAIDELIMDYKKSPESVLSIYMAPMAAFYATRMSLSSPVKVTATSGYAGNGRDKVLEYEQGVLSPLTGTEDFDGYTPKNKKLYTYPYNAVHISDNSTGELVLRYEFWDGYRPQLRIRPIGMAPACIVLNPYNYGGKDTSAGNLDMSLTLSDYPQCSWNTDSWKEYIATGGLAGTLINLGSSVSGSVIGMGFAQNNAGMAGGITGIASGAASAGLNIWQAWHAADVCHGSASPGNLNCSSGDQTFTVSRMHVTADYARMIDDYFTRFGYAQNRIMTPNPQARSKWTYIKTCGCTIGARQSSGSAGLPPGDDMRKICSILDNGITFWQMTADIGDYSQENGLY